MKSSRSHYYCLLSSPTVLTFLVSAVSLFSSFLSVQAFQNTPSRGSIMTRVRTNLTTNLPDSVALGVVEVQWQGQWGSVCHQGFTQQDAKVVCRSLGYEGGWVVPFYRSYLGRASGPVWVEEPQCRGDEAWLGDCHGTVWGASRCNHSLDISIFCFDQGLNVRLSGGERNEGRVELQLGGQWGTICSPFFDHLDAQVVCRMLGYSGESQAVLGAGRGEGPMWQLALDCLGSEQWLDQCRIRLLARPCPRSSSAGVKCTNSRGQVDSALRTLLPAECGQPEDASTIFLLNLSKVRGGRVPTRYNAPWLVSIRLSTSGRQSFCGGSILTEDLVLTAAHCLEDLSPLALVVRVGDHDSLYFEDTEEDFFVEKTISHEQFDRITNNDIAILKIQRKAGRGIRFGPRVRPICLPRTMDSYLSLQDCTVIGRGYFSPQERNTNTPREGPAMILPDRFCEVIGSVFYTSSMVCAGLLNKPISPCPGDSGGPLACTVNGRRTVYGLVSFGQGCIPDVTPAVYTRMTKFLPWILEKILIMKGLKS